LRVAVIGANGQLGSDIMTVFGNSAVPYTHSEIDVTDYDSLKLIKEVDAIINTAAFHKVDGCENDPLKALNVNSLGARNVARWSREIGATAIYIGTDYVFDGKKTMPYTEEDVPNPINSYGISKLAGELYTRSINEKHYIFRVSSLFGIAGASGKGSNFVETMIRKAGSGERIQVVDDIIMTPTHAQDAAETIRAVLQAGAEKVPYGTYHASNSGQCSWYEFARDIFGMLNVNADLARISSEPQPTIRRPAFSALASSLPEHGIKIRHWKEALKDYLIKKGHLKRV